MAGVVGAVPTFVRDMRYVTRKRMEAGEEREGDPGTGTPRGPPDSPLFARLAPRKSYPSRGWLAGFKTFYTLITGGRGERGTC